MKNCEMWKIKNWEIKKKENERRNHVGSQIDKKRIGIYILKLIKKIK